MSERLVTNSDLAYDMARAEVPFREVAMAAEQHGVRDIAELMVARALAASTEAEDRAYRVTLATANDFVDFGLRHGYARQLPTRAWNRLARAQALGCVNLEYITGPPASAVSPNAKAYYYDELRVESLAREVRRIQVQVARHPHRQLTDYFGSGVGSGVFNFLLAFIEVNASEDSPANEQAALARSFQL